MKRIGFIFLLLMIPLVSFAKPPEKSKFYDFNEQVIDGEIKKPTTLYTNARQKVRFERLLKFKKVVYSRFIRNIKGKNIQMIEKKETLHETMSR
jgi:hypothetical protein